MFIPVKWTARQTYAAVRSVPEVTALYNAHYATCTEARATLAECEAAALVLTTLDLNQMERDLFLADPENKNEAIYDAATAEMAVVIGAAS